MHSYRNSIGDVSLPDYEVWEISDEGSNAMNYLMISLAWILWLLNQFINVNILLSYLIAVMADTYSEVVAKQQVYHFR